jgi:hypothetical protein
MVIVLVEIRKSLSKEDVTGREDVAYVADREDITDREDVTYVTDRKDVAFG